MRAAGSVVATGDGGGGLWNELCRVDEARLTRHAVVTAKDEEGGKTVKGFQGEIRTLYRVNFTRSPLHGVQYRVSIPGCWLRLSYYLEKI